MADFEELSFVIPGYTPETMPFNLLLEYFQHLSVLLGDPTRLHLLDIQKSSVAPLFHMDKTAAFEAYDRISRIQRGDGTSRQSDALSHLRRMVRRDSPGSERPAILRSRTRVLLEIPPSSKPQEALSGIRQQSTFDGQLIRIGGAGEYASLQVQELSGNIASGFTAPRILAKELARLLWEPVRLSGTAVWGRSEEGVWSIEKMQVQSYERLEDESLGTTIERLRSAGVEWPSDALDRLSHDRGTI